MKLTWAQRNKEKCRASHKKWYLKSKERYKEMKRKYKANNRGRILARNRELYQKNREKILKRKKARRLPPDVKSKSAAYSLAVRLKNHDRYMIGRHKTKKNKRPGFLYFFKCITPGYYKVGFTKDWKQRKGNYSGPSAIKRVYFVRPVADMSYAEVHMKLFLTKWGFTQTSFKSDWMELEHEKVF